MVSIETFAMLDLRVGRIVEVADLEGAKGPMYRLRVDLGELGIKNMVAGIKNYYKKEELLGKYVAVVANMDPKKIANFTSEGMILAAQDDTKITLLQPDSEVKPGSKIR